MSTEIDTYVLTRVNKFITLYIRRNVQTHSTRDEGGSELSKYVHSRAVKSRISKNNILFKNLITDTICYAQTFR